METLTVTPIHPLVFRGRLDPCNARFPRTKVKSPGGRWSFDVPVGLQNLEFATEVFEMSGEKSRRSEGTEGDYSEREKRRDSKAIPLSEGSGMTLPPIHNVRFSRHLVPISSVISYFFDHAVVVSSIIIHSSCGMQWHGGRGLTTPHRLSWVNEAGRRGCQ